MNVFEASVQDAECVADLLQNVVLEREAAVFADVPDLVGGGSLATIPLQPDAYALVPYQAPREQSTTEAVTRSYSEPFGDVDPKGSPSVPCLSHPSGSRSCVIIYMHHVSC